MRYHAITALATTIAAAVPRMVQSANGLHDEVLFAVNVIGADRF
jgi:hypothetical protein